jgi:glycosyltransferase involved in cell wall biosynthesis
MKILLIHNYYRKKNIGGEDIVFDAEVGALKKRLGDSNVFVYTVSSDDTTGWRLLFSIWFSLSQYRAVYALVKKHNIDIVHVHNFFPVLTPSVFVAAKNAGAGVVHTLHNYRLWCISGILYNAVDGVHEYCATKRFSWRCVQHKSYHDSFVQSLFIGIVFWWYKCMQMFGYIDYYIALTGFQKNKIISFFVPAEKIILKLVIRKIIICMLVDWNLQKVYLTFYVRGNLLIPV